jgi:RNA polymerase sigma-70 factor (ECF subfamily)
MGGSSSTCWWLVRGAAEGRAEEREEFARRYAPLLRAYLGARWRQSPLRGDVEDAVQEIFLECFRKGGVLERADEEQPGGFRAFLFGVARNVALRFERRRGAAREGPADDPAWLDQLPRDETSASRLFDRAWAEAVLRQAAELQEERARTVGDDALRRVELLRLRFREDRPIREIATLWGEEPSRVHKAYERARKEFLAALRDVVEFHHPGSRADIDRRCTELLELVR